MFVHIAFVRRCASYAWAESAASSRTHTPCTTVRTHRIYLYAYNVYDRTHTTSMTIRIQTQRQSVLPVCTMSCIYRGRECRLRRGRVCCLCARRAAYTEAESAAFAEAECAVCVPFMQSTERACLAVSLCTNSKTIYTQTRVHTHTRIHSTRLPRRPYSKAPLPSPSTASSASTTTCTWQRTTETTAGIKHFSDSNRYIVMRKQS